MAPDPLTSDCVGRVHSVETGGTVDGPGIRYVVFLSGCPLRCLYCHNPDTRCPNSGHAMTVDEIVNDLLRYKDFMGMTGGGVTVSGGEPLMQEAFVTELFRRCKAEGISTALDTSGYLGARVSPDLLAVTDLVLLDIKTFNPQKHKVVTGIELAPVLDFAQACRAANVPLWIRCVVVPGLTDDLDDLRRLAAYLKTFDTLLRCVEILPFHKMGEAKWRELGLAYALSDVRPPSSVQIDAIRALFREAGFETR